MSQDFNHRVSIVVNKELPSWQVLNTVAHIAAYFGNRMGKTFGTDEFFKTNDEVLYPRNSQYAIIVLSARPEQLAVFAKSTDVTKGVQSMCFIREMIETTDDNEIAHQLASKNSADVERLGVGIFGENQEVKNLTKEFRLWS